MDFLDDSDNVEDGLAFFFLDDVPASADISSSSLSSPPSSLSADRVTPATGFS
jgi:hypothetical protein